MHCAQCAGDRKFWCGMENQCIDQSQICDGRQDCPSGQEIVRRDSRNKGDFYLLLTYLII